MSFARCLRAHRPKRPEKGTSRVAGLPQAHNPSRCRGGAAGFRGLILVIMVTVVIRYNRHTIYQRGLSVTGIISHLMCSLGPPDLCRMPKSKWGVLPGWSSN